MNKDLAANLLELVARLQDESLPIEWDEAAELLTDVPGGEHLLLELRRRNIPLLAAFFGIGGFRQEFVDECISAEKRGELLREILPYSLLFDERYTILERACLIQQAHYDAVKFCEGVMAAGDRYYGDRRFGDAASEALLAIAAHQNLLRGAEKPELPEKELLRAAPTGVSIDDSLLTPVNAPLSPPQKREAGLFARMKRRNFFIRR